MKRIIASALALAVTAAVPAVAGAADQNRDGRYYDNGRAYDRDYPRYRPSYRNDREWRRHHWRVGQRMDRGFYGSRVDWRRHHLPRPGYGSTWVYIDGVYLQISDRNGVIIAVR